MGSNNNKQAVKTIAEEVARAMRNYIDNNNKTYVNKQISNSISGTSSSGGGGGTMPGSINASQVRGLYNTVAGYIINASQASAQGDEVAGRIISTLSGIAAVELQSATIDTAQIRNLYASYGDFIELVAEHATIQGVDTEELYATLAEIGLSNIGTANIGFAQVKDLTTQTAIIREGAGGKLFIDRLAVTDANIVSLTVGELMVRDTNGKLSRVYVNGQGQVVTEPASFSGADMLNNASVAGGKLIENTITARELNVSSIFADNALIGAIKAANIDTTDLFANTAFVNSLYASTIQAANAGSDIDISNNSVITLLDDKIGLIVEDGSTASSITLTSGMIDAVSDIVDIKASTIDLSANTSISAIVQSAVENQIYYRMDIISTGDILSDSVTSTTLSAKVYKGNTDYTTSAAAAGFVWTRISSDTAGDIVWNNTAAHQGVKTITVNRNDVRYNATFQCQYSQASTVLATGSKAIIDMSDGKTLSVHLGSNLPVTQIYDSNTSQYAPNWASSDLIVTPTVVLNSEALSLSNSSLAIAWMRKQSNGTETNLTTGETVTNKVLHVSANVLDSETSGQIAYVAYVTYTNADSTTITASDSITFSQIKTGRDSVVKDVVIEGEQVFKYASGSNVSSPESIRLEANCQNCSVVGWYYKAFNGQWTAYPSNLDNLTREDNELYVHSTDLVFNDDVAVIQVVTDETGLTDTFSIYKVHDGAAGQNGQNGQNGQDGVGVSSTEVRYQVSSSGTTAPTGTWLSNVPETTAGQYLWTRTIINYTNSTYSTQYSVAYHGDTGSAGQNGTSVTITSKSVTYQEGTSGTTAPTGTWASTIPTIGQGNYLWTKTEVHYSDGNSTIAYSIARQGINGTNGENGLPGADGTSSYVHIKYSAYANPTNAQMTETPSEYIGICTDSNVSDPTTASSYTWSKFMGTDGENGLPGRNGTDGTSTYVHFAYATSADGQSNFSTTQFTGATYIGVLADNTQADSTVPSAYSWSLIKGDKGDQGEPGNDGTSVTITSKSVTYQEGTSATTAPSGNWSTTVPSVSQGNYLWTKTEVVYSDGNSTIAYSVARQGINGTNGQDGLPGQNGVDGTSSYVHIKYSAYANPTNAQMTETPSEYIGICVNSSVSDPTTASSYTWSKFMGTDGTNGQPGTNGTNGRSAYVHFAYATSSNGVQNFSTTHFAGATYIGVRTDEVVADSTTPSDYTWSLIKGDKGEKGDDGTSITITNRSVTYKEGTSGTSAPSGTWSTTIPSVTAGNYLWTKTEVTYSDNSSTLAYSVARQGIDGTNGTDGLPGRDGTNGTSNYIHIKYSAYANPTNAQMTETPSEYIGICVDTNTSDPTTASSYTWSRFQGENGSNGSPGTNGTNGRSAFVHFAYSTSSNGTQNFSTTHFTGATYIGVLTDENQADSTTPSDYAWSLIKGDKGDKGDTGDDGDDGDDASVVFLTNENITFSANKDGQVASTTVNCNVVAYTGTTKVTPTVGTISGAPTGMSVSKGSATSNEIPITITITNNATLGGSEQRQGSLSVPVTSPVNTTLTITWSKVNTGATGAAGQNGSNGESAVAFMVYAPNGTVFTNGSGTLTINTAAYLGATPITSGATYTWDKYTSGSWVAIQSATSSSLTVNGSTVAGSASYRCNMTYAGITYRDIITLTDKTDNYQAVIDSTGGNVFKNTIGSSTLRCRLFQNGSEVDTQGVLYAYQWGKINKNGNTESWSTTGKSISVTGSDVDTKTTFVCEVKDTTLAAAYQLKAVCQFTIVDLNDPVQSGTAPSNPVVDMLWIDTSASPNVLKRWNGTAWVAVSNVDTAALETRLTNIETSITEQGGAISLRATKEEVGLIEDRVTSNETQIGQLVVDYEGVSIAVAQKSTNYRQVEAPEGAQVGDIWIQPVVSGPLAGTEKTYQAIEPASELGLELAYDENGYLLYRYEEGIEPEYQYEVTVTQNGQLALSGDTGYYIVDNELLPSMWREVKGDAVAALEVSVNGIGAAVSDLDGNISLVSQKANKIDWIVQGDDIAEMSMTEEAIDMVADAVNLRADSIDLTANNSVRITTYSQIDSSVINSLDLTENTYVAPAIEEANKSRMWFEFDYESGLTTRRPEYVDENNVLHEKSNWSTQITEDGFYINHDSIPGDHHAASFHENVFEPRSIRMGQLVCKATSRGGWAWKRV